MDNITISEVSKVYKGGMTGLDHVSFSVGPGVFGLLGHNGAGKTTLMRAIVTNLRPTEGTISVMGHDTRLEGNAVRRQIGYLPQELGMYDNLSVREFVRYMALLKGVRDPAQVNRALEWVGMTESAKQKIGRLSGGMRRRVGIAQAMIGEPDVLVVDEPTAGLDPEERVRFRSVLSHYALNGRTVLLSTHIIEDVHQLCARLAVLRKGKLFFCGNQEELMKKTAGKVKRVILPDEAALARLMARVPVISTNYENGGILARVIDEEGAFPEPAESETLEDAYVYCMGGEMHA